MSGFDFPPASSSSPTDLDHSQLPERFEQLRQALQRNREAERAGYDQAAEERQASSPMPPTTRNSLRRRRSSRNGPEPSENREPNSNHDSSTPSDPFSVIRRPRATPSGRYSRSLRRERTHRGGDDLGLAGVAREAQAGERINQVTRNLVEYLDHRFPGGLGTRGTNSESSSSYPEPDPYPFGSPPPFERITLAPLDSSRQSHRGDDGVIRERPRLPRNSDIWNRPQNNGRPGESSRSIRNSPRPSWAMRRSMPSPPPLPTSLRDRIEPARSERHPRALKRRKLDHEDGPKGFTGFKYGYYGQVVPGRLKMEIVTCDGGLYPHSHDKKELHLVDNVLKNDKSVYCTKSSKCNLLLRHQGETTFSVTKIVIKAPERGYTAPYVLPIFFYYLHCYRTVRC